MSSNFKRQCAVGAIGERKFKWLIENSNYCWFYPGGKNVECPDKPTLKDVTQDSAWQNADDVDFLLTSGECEWVCSHFENKNKADMKTERHEVKTNIRTHEGNNPTQNILVETESNSKLFETGEYWPITIDPQTKEEVRIRKGVGWWKKREHKADWYHFFNSAGCAAAVSEEKTQAFLNDPNIPDGAGLIKKWPVDYMLSVRGSYLKRIIDSGKYPEKPCGKGKGYMIPVTDLVAGKKLNLNGSVKLVTFNAGAFENDNNIILNFILDDDQVIVKGENAKLNRKEVYCPTEFFEAMGGYAEGDTEELLNFSLSGIQDFMKLQGVLKQAFGEYLDLGDTIRIVRQGAVSNFYSKHRRETIEFPDFQIEPFMKCCKPY